ncbi:MAG: hypothetical protein ABI811_02435 [Acidobacteriota bacterium]
MRTTITLDPDVNKAAMQMARVSGQRFGKVLSELARRGLHPPEAPRKRSTRRFPTFPVPLGTPMISAQKIQDVIDEEGLI